MRALLIPLLATVAAFACATAPSADRAESAAAPQRILPGYCARCHGSQGRGDGPLAVNLTPRPRDFSDASWQASVSDERIAEVITKGGTVAGLSPVMPAHAGFAENPEALARIVGAVRRCSETQ